MEASISRAGRKAAQQGVQTISFADKKLQINEGFVQKGQVQCRRGDFYLSMLYN
jgi:hypothetical protein